MFNNLLFILIFLFNKIYLKSMLSCIIRKFDNIIYLYKQHDACQEGDHPVIEPNVNYYYLVIIIIIE